MENLLFVATQVGVLFSLMAVGALCRKLKLLDDASVKGIVNVLVLVVTPCLIVDCFQRPFDLASLRSLALAPFRGVDRTMSLALVTAASAPVAAMVSMFASKYGRDVDMSVGLVSGTTLLSMVTMPLAISLAMKVL